MKLMAKKCLFEGEFTVKVSIKWLIFQACNIVNFSNGVMSHHELPCKAIAACLAPIYGKTSQVLSREGWITWAYLTSRVQKVKSNNRQVNLRCCKNKIYKEGVDSHVYIAICVIICIFLNFLKKKNTSVIPLQGDCRFGQNPSFFQIRISEGQKQLWTGLI